MLRLSKFRNRTYIFILSTIVICVCDVTNFALIYSIIKSKIDFGDVIWNIHIVIYYFLTSFIMIITHFLSSPRMRLLQTIMEISSKLSSKSYQKLSRLIHVKDVLSNVVRIVQLSIKMSKLLKAQDNFFAILFGLFTMYFALYSYIKYLYI